MSAPQPKQMIPRKAEMSPKIVNARPKVSKISKIPIAIITTGTGRSYAWPRE